jgi:nucleoside-diphosphate-sugar epimerase
MKILITGNLGYVGAWLGNYLRAQYPDAWIAGYDTGYFQQCITTQGYAPERVVNVQHYGDVRSFPAQLLEGYDHVIHLAAISNDPIGNKFEQVTLDVNYKASVDIAQKAIDAGVKSFVFASSCSVYGAAGDDAKTETSELNPLTAYAKSKVMAEEGLSALNRGNTTITCLRFATACGISDRLRLDLVLNDFVASAITSGRINILSDGTPWRPLINVRDMALAMHWAIQRTGDPFLVCNTGSNTWNYTVKQLAEKVQEQIPGTTVSINTDAPPDKRSYRVNFDLFHSMAGSFNPHYTVEQTISGLLAGLRANHFSDENFRTGGLMRLNILNNYLSGQLLDSQLYWTQQS